MHLAGSVGLIHQTTEILLDEQLRLPPGVVGQAQVAPDYVLKQTHRWLLRKHLYLHGFKSFRVAVLEEPDGVRAIGCAHKSFSVDGVDAVRSAPSIFLNPRQRSSNGVNRGFGASHLPVNEPTS
jgi:hypothetical protein